MIGAFGENFPYSNFHDLNLDWVIKVVKDFFTKYPELIEDINKKLNKPVFDSNGNLNDVLMSNGDGTTKWGTLGITFYPEILQAVSEWLDDHPEATTTVQDGSLTLPKFTEYLKYLTVRNQSGAIIPVYIGDYLCNANYLPSAVYVNGNEVITIDAPSRSYAISQQNGIGHVRHFSLSTNTEGNSQNVLVGHGNSIAFDGTYYYVSPIWEYDSEGETRISSVYKYNSSFLYIEEIPTASPITGVSYDAVTGDLYAISGKYVLKYAEGMFSLYSTISNYENYTENLTDEEKYFNQDLAVYNNEFYISSPYGNVLHGYIEESTCQITDFYYVNYFDSTGRFTLGELEGFEFTGDHLYAVMFCNLPDNLRNAFVVEIPINKGSQTSPVMNGIFSVANGTLTLSEETQSKFSLDAYDIRSIQQLHSRKDVDNYNAIQVPASNNVVDDNIIRIAEPITLELLGHYTCKQFSIHKGSFNIEAKGSGNLLTLTNQNYLINIMRCGQLMLTGEYTLNIDAPNMTNNQNSNFIGFGNNKALTIVKASVTETHGKVLKLGSNTIITDELYVGSERVLHAEDSFTIAGMGGCTWNSGKELYIYFPYARKFPSAFTTTGTLKPLGADGQIGASAGIDLTDTTNYNFTWTREDDYTYSLKITKSDNSAFANAVDKSNIYVANRVTFTKA